ncbi:MAG TPA: tellurite resistance TerB family protein [Rhodospirillaceae bacterium]|nr:tellurite resistance TerB family protein [Rhodospirillaceae bacterium]
MISHHAALIYTMVLVSAADGDMTDAEMRAIHEIVEFLPVFRDYDPELLPRTAGACAEMLGIDDGLDKILTQIKASLPVKLRDTAYALACDVAVADGDVNQEKLRVLEIIRHRLDVDRLTAAAIERGATARTRTA